MKCNAISTITPGVKYYQPAENVSGGQAQVIPDSDIKTEMLKNLDKHTLGIYKDGEIKYYNQRNLKNSNEKKKIFYVSGG